MDVPKHYGIRSHFRWTLYVLSQRVLSDNHQDVCSEKTRQLPNPRGFSSKSCRNVRSSQASPALFLHREIKAVVLLDSVFSEQSWADRGADRAG